MAAADDDRSKTDLQIAAAEVQRETNGKILSATKIESRNRAVYRIKVLTDDGRVRVIQIPERRVEKARQNATEESANPVGNEQDQSED